MTYFPKGLARTSNLEDIKAVAKYIGCHPAIIAGFKDTEAAGSGYWKDGRQKNLPEKHWVYKLAPKSKRAKLVRLGLAKKNWSRSNYGDLKTSDDRYNFNDKVAEIVGPEISAQATSWCSYQIMGFNAGKCGFASAMDMYFAFADDEAEAVLAVGKFLVKSGLRDELKRFDYNAITRIYNGPGQVEVYAPRLRRNTERWLDHDWGEVPAPTSKGKAWLAVGDGPEPPLGERVKQAQGMLKQAGYPVVVDGDFGNITRRAVWAFQKENDLKVDGMIGEKTLKELKLNSNSIPIVHDPNNDQVVPSGRELDTVKDLRQRGSQTVKTGDELQKIGVGVGGTVGAVELLPEIADGDSDSQNLTETISFGQDLLYLGRQVIEFLGEWWWAGALVGCVYFIYKGGYLKNHRLNKHKSMEHV